MAPLVAQHRRLSRLQQSFEDTLPPGWNSLCRVAAVEGSTLVIAAANGAIATNLKAYSPRLLENFRNVLEKKTMKEQQVTSIRIVVQPEISTWRGPTPTAIKLASCKTSVNDQQLDDLTQKLADSPLKRALKKIQAERQNLRKQALTDKTKSEKK
ncbi:MAG: DUF721 domain-containing protein [Rhodocyclaceae bacterium]|nr:DUF721 domain-containing protein [Rhodocyclaceae bacterium]MCA3028546.1 DUF721 domain-containing protein [Rhodocyclaceae bacterium]MCA3061594.1 DUF721 domain-containing protein [Rhodocyclaceae bacterium]MCA3063340.1 DUF721 domain-containing protein [Rhodocyclaceae bacterium]